MAAAVATWAAVVAVAMTNKTAAAVTTSKAAVGATTAVASPKGAAVAVHAIWTMKSRSKILS